MKDLVITWPKSRPLQSYLDELEAAAKRNESINFRVPTFPKIKCERCYIVYDGEIQGWNTILHYAERGPEEVKDPVNGGFWPAGNYIVRIPYWHEIEPTPMKGFQGYRYIDRSATCPDHAQIGGRNPMCPNCGEWLTPTE